jgi:hypothetical protein
LIVDGKFEEYKINHYIHEQKGCDPDKLTLGASFLDKINSQSEKPKQKPGISIVIYACPA